MTGREDTGTITSVLIVIVHKTNNMVLDKDDDGVCLVGLIASEHVLLVSVIMKVSLFA